MRLKQQITNALSATKIGKRAVQDQRYRIMLSASLSLLFNLSYAIYHGILGITGQSWWFSALWGYYTVLGVMRFSAVLCERKNGAAASLDTEYFVMKVTGCLLLLLGFILAGINYISLRDNIATQYSEITMIAIATYTFGKIGLSIAREIRHRHQPSPLFAVIRRISYADVAVSVLTMQRSMLVSFGGMEPRTIQLMNALTGAGVYLFIVFLGITMIAESKHSNRTVN